MLLVECVVFDEVFGDVFVVVDGVVVGWFGVCGWGGGIFVVDYECYWYVGEFGIWVLVGLEVEIVVEDWYVD